MKKNYILGAFAVASLAFAACSSDDLTEDLNNGSVTPNVPEEEVINGFRELGEFVLAAPAGSAEGQGKSRSIKDVTELGRPRGYYPLDSLIMMVNNPTVQPTSADCDKLFNPVYNKDASEYRTISSTHGLKFYYKLTDVKDNGIVNGRQYSQSGTIVLSNHRDGRNPISLKLSVFDVELLKNREHIPLNHFAYDVATAENPVRGTGLRYLSYNPIKIENERVSKEVTAPLAGRYLKLPEVDPESMVHPEYAKYKFLRGNNPAYPSSYNMVTETQDKYFMGDEFLFAAYAGKIYMLKTVNIQTEDGGYYRVMEYPVPKGQGFGGKAEADSITLSRMTTMINLSFMLVDGQEWSEKSYFVPENYGKTVKNFKNRFNGVDLSTLECPYATFDGFNSRYFVNHPDIRAKRVEGLSRMIMWAEGLASHTPDKPGKDIYRKGVSSMDLSYYLNGKLQRGFGIMGESYSVAFPGYAADVANQKIQFYVKINGKQIKISTTIDPNAGFSFNQNTSHNVMVFVDAAEFAAAVNAQSQPETLPSRANSDEYAELEVPSENVVVVAE